MLNALQQRSITPGHRPWSRHIISLNNNINKTIRWKSPKWVHLMNPDTPGPGGGGSTINRVDELAFCPEGVLLAVAYANQRIAIYDWDTVRAADQQGRERSMTMMSTTTTTTRQRRRYVLPPILSFSTPFAISRLQWNPTRPDQLAVGFKGVGTTHLYELDQVVAWQQQQQQQHRHRSTAQEHTSTWSQDSTTTFSQQHPPQQQPPRDSRYPPPTTYTELKVSSNPSRCQGSVLALLFYNDWILMSVGNQVMGYRRRDAMLQWRYQPRRSNNMTDSVTCLAPLYHCAYFLLATQSGRMIVLDANRKERTALSLHDQPIVVDEWQTRTPTTGTSTTPSSIIVNLQVSAAVHNCRHWMYVTANGWVYRGDLLLEQPPPPIPPPPNTTSGRQQQQQQFRPKPTNNRSRGMFAIQRKSPTTTSTNPTANPAPVIPDVYCQVGRTQQVLYAPPKVALYNAQGESIGDDPHAYSTPLEPLVSQFVHSGAVLFSKIPRTSKYLGHHDKYMVDSQPKLVRDTTESLGLVLLVHGRDEEQPPATTTTIPVKELPQSFVMHPGGEWMVLGTRHGLVLMAHRRW